MMELINFVSTDYIYWRGVVRRSDGAFPQYDYTLIKTFIPSLEEGCMKRLNELGLTSFTSCKSTGNIRSFGPIETFVDLKLSFPSGKYKVDAEKCMQDPQRPEIQVLLLDLIAGNVGREHYQFHPRWLFCKYDKDYAEIELRRKTWELEIVGKFGQVTGSNPENIAKNALVTKEARLAFQKYFHYDWSFKSWPIQRCIFRNPVGNISANFYVRLKRKNVQLNEKGQLTSEYHKLIEAFMNQNIFRWTDDYWKLDSIKISGGNYKV